MSSRFVDVQAWDCTDEEYFDGAAVGSSAIGRAIGFGGPSPKRGSIGNAKHLAILQPGIFRERVVVPPAEVLPGSGEGQRKRRAEWEAANRDKIVLTPAEMGESMQTLLVATASVKLQSILRRRGGRIEQSYRCTDTVTGLTIRIRPDWHDAALVLDVKSSEDPSPSGFDRSIYRYGYAIQAALYVDVLTPLLGRPPRWIWGAIGKERIGFRAADDPILEMGRRLYSAGLIALAKAYESAQEPTLWWEEKVLPARPPFPADLDEVARIEQHVGIEP